MFDLDIFVCLSVGATWCLVLSSSLHLRIYPSIYSLSVYTLYNCFSKLSVFLNRIPAHPQLTLNGLSRQFLYKKHICAYVTWSREMSQLSKISISIFLHHILISEICFILMQTLYELNIRLQSYEGFDNAKNNMKQRNLNVTVFANISDIRLIPLDRVSHAAPYNFQEQTWKCLVITASQNATRKVV